MSAHRVDASTKLRIGRFKYRLELRRREILHTAIVLLDALAVCAAAWSFVIASVLSLANAGAAVQAWTACLGAVVAVVVLTPIVALWAT
jgi:uncharacterized membrane protein required for colicin V production